MTGMRGKSSLLDAQLLAMFSGVTWQHILQVLNAAPHTRLLLESRLANSSANTT